jgi:hypothetical protein
MNIQEFYTFTSSSKDLYDSALGIKSMMDKLPEFLAHRIRETNAESLHHFKHSWIYTYSDGYAAVFENCFIGDFNLTVDVYCFLDHIEVELFNRTEIKLVSGNFLEHFLNQLGDQHGFSLTENKQRYTKSFPLPEGERQVARLLQSLNSAVDHHPLNKKEVTS